jgi:uncharacterized protein YqjF (DUF2071 family)
VRDILSELLETPARQAGVLEHTQHRPWPLPPRAWTMAQTWDRLLFAHWRCAPDALRALVPEPLQLDVRDGAAWLAITPFCCEGLRLRGLPPLPGLSTFYEVNVRTYVTHGERPGIWFFSLDASSAIAVGGAQLSYRLPYRRAAIQLREQGGWVDVACEPAQEPTRRFAARYRGRGALFRAEPGSLEEFLVERYCLYAEDRVGRLYRADIHHAPWSLQAGDAELEEVALAPAGVELEGEPLLHVAARQDTLVWPLEAV